MAKTAGETLKFIRESKNLTQQSVSEGILSRSNYQKAEHGEVMPSFDRFAAIVSKLNITFDEFIFVRNDYKPTEKQMLLYQYAEFRTSSQENKIEKLISECDEYLSKKADQLIFDIRACLEGILLAEKEHDFSHARLKVHYIWERLSKSEQLYWNDILLLRNIIFIFELESAIHITKQLLKQLERYKYLYDTKNMAVSLRINMGTICLMNDRYDLALPYFEEAIPLARKARLYFSYCMVLLKKGITLQLMNNGQNDGIDFIQKALNISQALGDQELYESLEKELAHYEMTFHC
ncbi:helix-turn-helix domain-containing protein [Listeria costaricensis]|uniref:helix-turn-helix domain-containing protein n=1 Tax=Listeria costaricensis TaxID=2026604 RepID=UPI0013C4AA3F|nr:Rgg/GadR/MutR family transcriptional regulator [Listeria costaricensis]